MDISAAPVGEFLTSVAADLPSPGAGAVAGVALGLASACAGKALRIAARRAEDARLAEAAEQADGLARRAVAGAQRDCDVFPALLKSRSDDDGAHARLKSDINASLALCRELRALLQAHAHEVPPDLVGDLAAALHLLDAAERIHASNLAEL